MTDNETIELLRPYTQQLLKEVYEKRMTREERIEQAKEFWLLNDGSTFEVMVDYAEMVAKEAVEETVKERDEFWSHCVAM